MATPTEHTSRDYAAFLSGPAGFDTYAFTTSTDPAQAVRNGIAYSPQIVDFPAPADNAPDDFGIIASGSFEVEIADEPTDEDWPLLDSSGNFLLADSGTEQLVQDY